MQSMPSVFAQWTDQPVVLQVAAAELRVPLRGVIVGETEHAVRFRVNDSWDIDIYKSMILAVEQDAWMDSIT
jgi:type II secretory pathway component PulC